MLCIYCRERDANAREHYIPQCFGRFENSELLVDRLCQPCNERLGKLDRVLCRKSPEAVARKMLGVKGQKDSNPAIFQPVKPGGEHIEIRGVDPETGYELLWFLGDQPKTTGAITQMVVDHPDGSRQNIAIPLSIQSPRELEEFLTAQGVSSPFEAYVIAQHGDEERAARIFSGYRQTRWQRRQTGVTVERQAVSTRISNEYLRALTKVAFHFALQYVPTITGAEDEFGDVRRFLFEGIGEGQRFVREQPRLNATWYGHVAQVVAPLRAPVVVNPQLFVGPGEIRTSAWHVEIGHNPTRLHVESQLTLWFGLAQKPDGSFQGGPIIQLSGWPTA